MVSMSKLCVQKMSWIVKGKRLEVRETTVTNQKIMNKRREREREERRERTGEGGQQQAHKQWRTSKEIKSQGHDEE